MANLAVVAFCYTIPGGHTNSSYEDALGLWVGGQLSVPFSEEIPAQLGGVGCSQRCCGGERASHHGIGHHQPLALGRVKPPSPPIPHGVSRPCVELGPHETPSC